MFRHPAFLLLAFCPLPALAQVRAGDITVDGRAGDWLGQPPLLTDPVTDVRGRAGCFDIKRVCMAVDSEAIVVMIQTREPPSLDGRAVAYGFALECDDDKSTWDYEVLVAGDGREVSAWSLWALAAPGREARALGPFGATAAVGEVVEIRLPLHLLGRKLVYPISLAARVWDAAGRSYADEAPDAGGALVRAPGEESPRQSRPGQSLRPAAIRIDGRRDDWTGSEPIGRDPAGDAAGRDPSMDLLALHACSDETSLVLMLECASPPAATGKAAYWFTLHARGGPWNDVQVGVWGDGRRMSQNWLWSLDPGGGPPKGRTAEGVEASAGEVLEVKIPLALLGGPAVYPMHIAAMSALAGTNEAADLLPDAPPHIGCELSAPPAAAVETEQGRKRRTMPPENPQ